MKQSHQVNQPRLNSQLLQIKQRQRILHPLLSRFLNQVVSQPLKQQVNQLLKIHRPKFQQVQQRYQHRLSS